MRPGEDDAGGVVWEPTCLGDKMIVALSGIHQLMILLAVLHIAWAANWPPYVVKNVTLACATGLAGACWSITVITSYGTFRRKEHTFWSHCDIEIFFSWCSMGLLCNAAFLRVYRNWKRLVRHDRNMWQTEWQLLLMMAPFLLPNMFYLCRPDVLQFNPVTQECARDYLIITPILGVYCLGLVLLALYLVVRMGHLRRQFSEYKNVRRVAVAIILAPVLLVIIDGATGPEHGALRRRMVVILSIFITGILFWIPVHQSVWAFIIKDEEYLDVYAHGFYGLPTPAQVRESLGNKFTDEELRQEYQGYAKTGMPPELMRFYGLVLERDSMEGYFERQALTMEIIDGYIREGSPFQAANATGCTIYALSLVDGLKGVHLSEECRERVLNSDVIKIDIFEEARVETLKAIQDNFEQCKSETSTAYPGLQIFRGKARWRPPIVWAGALPMPGASGPSATSGTSGTSSFQGTQQRADITPPVVSSPNAGGSLCYSSDGGDVDSPVSSKMLSPSKV